MPNALACKLGKSPAEIVRLREELKGLYTLLHELALTDDRDAESAD